MCFMGLSREHESSEGMCSLVQRLVFARFQRGPSFYCQTYDQTLLKLALGCLRVVLLRQRVFGMYYSCHENVTRISAWAVEGS